MSVPLDLSEVARKRAHLGSALSALVSPIGDPVKIAVRLDCGHELDLSEVQRLADNRNLALKPVKRYEKNKDWDRVRDLRNSAMDRYRCPCCRENITKEPLKLTCVTEIQAFLMRVEENFGQGRKDCKDDAEFSKKYDALVKEFKEFPRINNGRPA